MDKAAALDILNGNAWFAALEPALAHEILRVGHMRRVTNELLFAVGDEPNGLFAVLAGDVHISQTSADGRHGLLLIATAGSWFGETSLLDGHPRFSEAFAVGSCDLLHLSVSAFRALTHDNISNLSAFVRVQCEHYRLAMAHVASLSVSPARVRVAQRLIFYSRTQRESGKAANVVRLSQEELASAVGISRQALNVHLKRLERDGIISVSYASVRVHKFAELERLIKQGGGTSHILRTAGDDRSDL
jgi:CRP-like cAMP-binding protein